MAGESIRFITIPEQKIVVEEGTYEFTLRELPAHSYNRFLGLRLALDQGNDELLRASADEIPEVAARLLSDTREVFRLVLGDFDEEFERKYLSHPSVQAQILKVQDDLNETEAVLKNLAGRLADGR